MSAQLPAERRFVAEVDCRTRLKTAEQVAGFSAGAPGAYAPPEPAFAAPARFIDRFEVHAIDHLDGPRVGAAVLFAGPDHKADSDGALAFAVRAAGLLSAGAGVVIVDALPGPPAWATHLHSLTGTYPIARRPRGGEAVVLAVQPEVRADGEQFAVWPHAVAPGFPLPTVPVPVRGAMHLKLDLEATYAEACRRGRIE